MAKSEINLLVVEDNPDIRDVIEAVLSLHATVQGVGTLEEARDRLREHRFDGAFVNLGLPGGDSGLEIVPELVQQGVSSIIITSTGIDRVFDQARKEPGVSGILQEPFDIKDLEEIVEGIRLRKISQTNP